MNMQETTSYERYQRQIILRGFGQAGQEKLLRAKVLVIGAGGLGCPALLYLAAAGIGKLGVVDDDLIQLHNLHRQPLYAMENLEKPKAQTAAAFLRQLNPGLTIVAHQERLTTNNALDLLSGYDIIVDGTDNFSSRYLINDACVLLNKPLVAGAVSQYEGQLAIFNVERKGEEKVNYRDLFPEPPADGEVMSCAESGVLGVLPGIIGTMLAAETIKLITGIGQALANRLFLYNVLNNQGYELILQKKKGGDTGLPYSAEQFRQTDYAVFCGTKSHLYDIQAETFLSWVESGKVRIIDVRESGEEPRILDFDHEHIPLTQLSQRFEMREQERVLFFCQSGIRSRQAVRWMHEKYGQDKKFYSLQGGILNVWKHQE